ncbi:MAG TPA: deoxyribose-phosphate aldolase [Synergistales bacterium]|nr:deoxyribose-phosphate aldolase [Synergistales bacterium]HRV71588.1 deoxyribose-phosphate aldolase [Thermovirgaceae bacterium]
MIDLTDIELLSQRARQKAARAEAGFYDRPSPNSIRESIDHTLLFPAPVAEEISVLCEEAVRFGFASVCVPMTSLPEAVRILTGTGVRVGTVAGFPLGASPLSIKASEIRWAIEHGADEIDTVINIPAARESNRQMIREELFALREAAQGKTLKVILEMPLLNDTQIITTLRLAEQAGVDYVKTCTGFAGSVTYYHVALLRTAASATMKIKASAGIRTYAAAEILMGLGADRLGTSSATKFLEPLSS